MKIEKILQYESQNKDTIILFKEGIFFRAYERSAMRFTEYVAPFKVFKKYYKIVNAEVCYLGFPMKSLDMLFQKVNITRFVDTKDFLVVYDCPSKGNFEVWKEQVKLPTVEDVKPQTLLRPDVSKKELKNLQIYKMGYDLLVELHRYAATMPRAHRYTVGERIRNEAIELSVAPHGSVGLRRLARAVWYGCRDRTERESSATVESCRARTLHSTLCWCGVGMRHATATVCRDGCVPPHTPVWGY